MSIRYADIVDREELLKATQNFLSHIALDAGRKSVVRRSTSEQPDHSNELLWDVSENSKLRRFSSYPAGLTSRPIKFAKDIKQEECNSRFLFVTKNSTIVSVFSVLPYQIQDSSPSKRKDSVEQDTRQHYAVTVSYAELLDETENPVNYYDPFWLENPERSTNNYKTDIVLPGLIVSFLEYENPESFKKDENDVFKEKWPEVEITLSKMKSIKRDLLKVAESKNLPIMVLCYAYCFYETLAFSKYINKVNRKLAAGACLLLAKKFLFCNVSILPELTEILRTSSRDIIVEEFKVLAALKFSLQYPESAIMPHYRRLVQH